MTPNQKLDELEQKYGLSPALLQRHFQCGYSEAVKMITDYRNEKELLRETMQIIYDTEDMIERDK